MSRRSMLAGSGLGVGIAAGALGATSATARQDGTPVAGAGMSIMAPTLGLASAMTALQAALAHAEQLGVPMFVVIIDAAGKVKASARQDGNGLASLTYGPAKAYSAVALGSPTDVLGATLGADPALLGSLLQNPDIVLLGGGAPIMIDGVIVGGIGVSGGSQEQDQECANAGVAALT